MKRNFMKKAVAVSLSAAMAFSLSAATALTASAASTVSMAKKATVTVGKKKTLTVKTNNKWKVIKVGSTAKKNVTIKKVSNTKVRLTGKKATKASTPVTVRVRVKKKTGNKAEKVLKCKVTVKKAATVTPAPTQTPEDITPTPTPEVQSSANVKNQAELDAALANSNIKTINIETADETSFEIKDGTYDVDLNVNAPAASVTNSATFKSITINAISSNTWTEKGKNNKFTLKAPSARFVLDPEAIVNEILVAMKSALKIEGNAKQPVPVKVDPAAEGSSIASEAVVEIQASAQVDITLEAAAKGSKIQLIRGQKAFKINITNNTGANIDVTDDKGTKVATAGPGTSSADAKVADTTTTPTPTPTPGASTTATDLTSAFVKSSDVTKDPTSVKSAVIVSTTSSSAVQTKPSVTFNFADAKVYTASQSATTSSSSISEVSGVSVEYSVKVIYDGSTVDVKKSDAGKALTIELDIPKAADESNAYKFEVYVNVKGNTTYNQGPSQKVGEYSGLLVSGDIENLTTGAGIITAGSWSLTGVTTETLYDEKNTGTEYIRVSADKAHQ